MAKATWRRFNSPKSLPTGLTFCGRHGWQADALPDQIQRHNGRERPKDSTPADDASEITANRRGKRRGDRIAGVENAQRLWHGILRNEAHDCRRGERPKSTNRDAEQRARSHEHREALRLGDKNQRSQHEPGEHDEHMAAVETSGNGRDKQARDYGEQP